MSRHTRVVYSGLVMPGLVPGIHAFLRGGKDVDGRNKPGHDAGARR